MINTYSPGKVKTMIPIAIEIAIGNNALYATTESCYYAICIKLQRRVTASIIVHKLCI